MDFTGEFAIDLYGKYYFVKYSCKKADKERDIKAKPQIIEYTYTSMTKDEYIKYKKETGEMTVLQTAYYYLERLAIELILPPLLPDLLRLP